MRQQDAALNIEQTVGNCNDRTGRILPAEPTWLIDLIRRVANASKRLEQITDLLPVRRPWFEKFETALAVLVLITGELSESVQEATNVRLTDLCPMRRTPRPPATANFVTSADHPSGMAR
jgi:hypothetical protein